MKSKYIALMGLLLAVALALSSIENIFTSVLPLGIRIGLANIVIMFAVIALDTKSAFILTILKSLFVFLTRGVTAFGMSICGGILSLVVILILYKKVNPSILLLSILGAIAHNIGQLFLASLITQNISTLLYGFILIIGGFSAGICTGIVLKIIIPYAERIKDRI